MTTSRHAPKPARADILAEIAQQKGRIQNLLADAAAREQAQNRLRHSEEQFRATFEHAAVGIAHVATDGRWLRVNPRLYDIVGYTREELLQKSFQDITHPEDLKADVQYVSQMLAGQISSYSREKRCVRKDGSLIWISMTVSLVQASPDALADGQEGADEPGYFVSILEDITARKQDEESLRHLASIVASSEDAILGKNLEGILLSWNQAAETIYGYQAGEVIGRSVSLLIPPDLPEDLPRILERVRRGERIEHYETTRLRKDGTPVAVSLSISPIRDSRGTVTGASTIARDISERKAAEAERSRLQQVIDEAAPRQHAFLRDVLGSVTEGKLRLCESAADLPLPLPRAEETLPLSVPSLGRFRQRVREVGTRQGMESKHLVDLITGVGEASMNAVVHGGGGEARLLSDEEGTLQVRIEDRGAGIGMDYLHRATLERGYTTAGSMGYGFYLMLKTCDRIWLLTGSTGTTIVVEQEREAPAPEWLLRAV